MNMVQQCFFFYYFKKIGIILIFILVLKISVSGFFKSGLFFILCISVFVKYYYKLYRIVSIGQFNLPEKIAQTVAINVENITVTAPLSLYAIKWVSMIIPIAHLPYVPSGMNSKILLIIIYNLIYLIIIIVNWKLIKYNKYPK